MVVLVAYVVVMYIVVVSIVVASVVVVSIVVMSIVVMSIVVASVVVASIVVVSVVVASVVVVASDVCCGLPRLVSLSTVDVWCDEEGFTPPHHIENCKGTVGSEAGDLSEPAVRRKSHKLETN